jgi:hypothetical protein
MLLMYLQSRPNLQGALFMHQPRVLPALVLVLSFGVALHAGATEVVGTLTTNHGATISGQGLDVQVAARQDYPVFSGDRIASRISQQTRPEAREQSSVLTIPETGLIKLAPDSAISVERVGDAYLLDVARGEIGFEFVPGAKVFMISGDERIDLGQGTGKGGVVVSADGSGGYLALADGSGGVRLLQLGTGALVYEGPAKAELILAEVSGIEEDVEGVGPLPLLGAGLAALLVAVDSQTDDETVGSGSGN